MSRELVREFRAAPWSSPTDVADFVQRTEGAPTESLVAMLQVLVDRRAAGEGRPHQLRCVVFGRVLEATPDREVFIPLLKALRTADEVAGTAFVTLAPKINNVSGHRDLVQLFRANSPQVRQWAMQITTRVGGKTAFGLLSRLASQADFAGRLEAIDAMVNMAGYHAVPALREALAPATSDEKRRILEFLGSTEFVSKNRDAALEAVAELFGDTDPTVVREAVEAFSRVADEDAFFEHVVPLLSGRSLELVQTVIAASAAHTSTRVIEMLREQLLLGPKTVRIKVLEALEAIGNEDVLPVVTEALEHKQIAVRLRAAAVLRELSARGTVDVARTIVWLLRSSDVEIKRVAADVARSIHDPEGRLWPLLLRYLRDEDWWVRERITDALVEMAGTHLTRHAANYLTDESDIVRRFGVEMLMRIKDPQSLGALVRAAGDDPDWWVQERAIEAIGALGDVRAVPYLVDFMQRIPDVATICMIALKQLGDRSAARPIAEAMDPSDVDQILVALDALEALEDTSVGDTLPALVTHPDHRIRTAAEDLIRKWRLEDELKGLDIAEATGLSALDRLLFAMARANGDDLILSPGQPPWVKRLGKVRPLTRQPLTEKQVHSLLLPQLTPAQRETLDQLKDIDFSHEVKTEGLRFRVNVFQQQTGLSAVFRIIKNEIPDLETLGLPDVIHGFGDMANGLVLIGGPTGSGKSTTLAALIDYINRTYARHIITLEDPIEVVHKPKQALINQREVGTHSRDFHSALRSTLREDPDVILVGEMRDLATISFAISAAETGHLVFGTVHTASADTSVDRLINAFPHGQQPQVRSILASSLRAVCCQYLAPRKDNRGRVPCVEILLNNDAVANLIRKGKTYQIPNLIQMSRELGMRSMDHELARLFRQGTISADIAYMRAMNKKDMEAVIDEVEGGGGRTAAAIDGSISGSHGAV